jgi:hypothetical protein
MLEDFNSKTLTHFIAITSQLFSSVCFPLSSFDAFRTGETFFLFTHNVPVTLHDLCLNEDRDILRTVEIMYA